MTRRADSESARIKSWQGLTSTQIVQKFQRPNSGNSWSSFPLIWMPPRSPWWLAWTEIPWTGISWPCANESLSTVSDKPQFSEKSKLTKATSGLAVSKDYEVVAQAVKPLSLASSSAKAKSIPRSCLIAAVPRFRRLSEVESASKASSIPMDGVAITAWLI